MFQIEAALELHQYIIMIPSHMHKGLSIYYGNKMGHIHKHSLR